MEKFTVHTGIAAPLPMSNVDTDKIIPKQFLRTIKRTGLGVNAFHEIRYDMHGKEAPDFVLNKPEYRDSSILITGENFGCGSSREHAPWALLDFGYRCIIAPSFADIFFNNAFKNGILALTLPQEHVDTLMRYATDLPHSSFTIDLQAQEIKVGEHILPFDIDPFRKKCLLEGLDDIGLTLEKEKTISQYEENGERERPWLFS